MVVAGRLRPLSVGTVLMGHHCDLDFLLCRLVRSKLGNEGTNMFNHMRSAPGVFALRASSQALSSW